MNHNTYTQIFNNGTTTTTTNVNNNNDNNNDNNNNNNNNNENNNTNNSLSSGDVSFPIYENITDLFKHFNLVFPSEFDNARSPVTTAVETGGRNYPMNHTLLYSPASNDSGPLKYNYNSHYNSNNNNNNNNNIALCTPNSTTLSTSNTIHSVNTPNVNMIAVPSGGSNDMFSEVSHSGKDSNVHTNNGNDMHPPAGYFPGPSSSSFPFHVTNNNLNHNNNNRSNSNKDRACGAGNLVFDPLPMHLLHPSESSRAPPSQPPQQAQPQFSSFSVPNSNVNNNHPMSLSVSGNQRHSFTSDLSSHELAKASDSGSFGNYVKTHTRQHPHHPSHYKPNKEPTGNPFQQNPHQFAASHDPSHSNANGNTSAAGWNAQSISPTTAPNSVCSLVDSDRAPRTETNSTPVTKEVFDPEFHFIYDVPTSAIAHLPPSRLSITRLVFCRNYQPQNPKSCAMGHRCKFVHVTCDLSQLTAHPIHVNYIWRSEELCTYPRLPAGERVEVLLPNLTEPSVWIPSERILRTQGSQQNVQQRKAGGSAPALELCAAYESEGVCRHGAACAAAHAVYVNKHITSDFKRNNAGCSLANFTDENSDRGDVESTNVVPNTNGKPRQQLQGRAEVPPSAAQSNDNKTTRIETQVPENKDDAMMYLCLRRSAKLQAVMEDCNSAGTLLFLPKDSTELHLFGSVPVGGLFPGLNQP